jgi:hypothetical protein
MGKSAPSAPNPYTTAGAQYQYGTEAAAFNKALNATDTVGPTGSTTNQISGYDPTTGAPIYTQTTSLTQPEQQLLQGTQQTGLTATNQAQQELGQMPTGALDSLGTAPNIQTNLDTSNVSALPSGQSLQALQQNAQNTALAGNMAAINPALDNQEEQLKAQLVNSGNGPGTPAYESAMSQFNAQRTQAGLQAAGAAENTGANISQVDYGEAATSNSQQYSQDLQTLTAQNQAKGMSQSDAIAQAQAQLAQRSGVASLAGSLNGLGGAQIPSSSGLPTASTSTPDIMTAFQNAYQGQLANYNANVGTEDAGIGSIATILAAMA